MWQNYKSFISFYFSFEGLKISLSVFLTNAQTRSWTGAHTRAHLRHSISQINSCGQFLTKKNGTIRKSLSAPVTNLLPIIFQFITLNVRGFYKCSRTSVETPRRPLYAVLFCQNYFQNSWRLSSFFLCTQKYSAMLSVALDSLPHLPFFLKWSLHKCMSERSFLSSAPWYVIGVPCFQHFA